MKNSVFFHIPKTGGTWVSRFLINQGGEANHPEKRHLNGLDRQHTPRKNIKTDKKTFCFVRHPASWYQSYWRYKTKGHEAIHKQDWNPKETEIDQCADTQFNNFVNKVLDRWPEGYVTKIFEESLEGIDYVGTQENLVWDLWDILKKCKEDIDLLVYMDNARVRVNVTLGGDAFYDKDTLQGVLNADKKIINKFYKVKRL